ncbi:MAG: S8 family serine peptidase, partial [Gammaproteobacteria bacterium]
DLGYATGTSFSAPLVTGGLAMMQQFFRGQMSNQELLARIYATANKEGKYANTMLYGQGLVDFGAAMNPVGTMLVETQASAYSLSATRLRPGGALGDGLSQSLTGREVVAFDQLGAPFWRSLPGMVDSDRRWSHSSRLRLQKFLSPGTSEVDAALTEAVPFAARGDWQFGLREQVLNAGSLLNLTEQAMTLTYAPDEEWEFTAFTTTARAGWRQGQERGAMLIWRPRGTGVGLRLGVLGEPHGLLGSETDGAFGRVAAHSAVAGLQWDGVWRQWRIGADVEWGRVHAAVGDGLLDGLSGVVTSAASLQASRRFNRRDKLLFSLSQPPRVERGSLHLRLPIGRTFTGELVQQDVVAHLRPSGRQIDLAAHWYRSGIGGGELRLGALYSRHADHIAGTSEFSVMLGWVSVF